MTLDEFHEWMYEIMWGYDDSRAAERAKKELIAQMIKSGELDENELTDDFKGSLDSCFPCISTNTILPVSS